MSRLTRREHLIRAGEEAIAYQIRDIVEELNASCPSPLTRLAADGGATRDSFLMQFVADMLNVPIAVASIEELSAAGAAYTAALAVGLSSRSQLLENHCTMAVMPVMDPETRRRLYAGWKHAVAMIRTNNQED
jgi:glycerol kinase